MRIFVGGLPRTATKDDVVKLFRQFGANDENVVLPRDRRTRRRKGFAYIDIAEADKVEAAIAVFSGFEVDGKPLTVCRAADRPPKAPRGRRAFAIVAMLAAATLCAAPVRAETASSDLALTLNPIIGSHKTYSGAVTLPPVPLPIFELHHRSGPFEFLASGLPPLGAIPYGDLLQGRAATQLTILEGTARVWNATHRYSVGLGETIYNQQTRYYNDPTTGGLAERQFSRVAGLRYELGMHTATQRGAFDATFSVAPNMRGTQFTQFDIATIRPNAAPEAAVQVDSAVRFSHPLNRRSELFYGLRYINYTAHYIEVHGLLSDRNSAVLPVFGYRTRIGA